MRKVAESYSLKFIIILCLILICLRFVCMTYIVNGESMNPTLDDKELGLAVRLPIKEINRFDIVVIEQDDKYLIKRVVGLPGEKVEYLNNILFINDVQIYDEYNYGLTNNFEVVLSKDEYFCLGDNREHSSDSRIYGAFNIKKIKAVSIFSKGE